VNKLLTDGTRNYIRSLELLLNVSNTFVQSLDITELLATMIDQLFTLLKRIDRGAILLIDKNTGTLKQVVTKTRQEDEESVSSEINYRKPVVERTLAEGKPVIMSDTKTADKGELSDNIREMNIGSVMCVPLNYNGEMQGVVYVGSGVPGAFRKDDLHLLVGLANTASMAIKNARLYEAVKAEVDGLRKAESALRERGKELKAKTKSLAACRPCRSYMAFPPEEIF
jgi:GAF domain-containing protein